MRPMHITPAEANTILVPSQVRHRYPQLWRYYSARQQAVVRESDSLWGDPVEQKPEGHCRIGFGNVNGVNSEKGQADVHAIGEALNDLQLDVLGLAETNNDWSRDDIRERFRYIIRQHTVQSKMSFSSSDDKFRTAYQPGGTVSIVTEHWVGCSGVGCDESGLGRWTEVSLQGRKGRSLTIITAYRPCKRSSQNPGIYSTFIQHYRLLLKRGVVNPDPRQQILDDLSKRIQQLREKGTEAAIMMDANDTLMQWNNAFAKWTRRHNLVDVHIMRHGTRDEPATSKGRTRIDYILATEHIASFVTKCGILEHDTICISDHRPLYVDLDLKAFLRGKPAMGTRIRTRQVRSDDPRSTKVYNDALQKAMDTSGIEKRVADLIEVIEKGQRPNEWEMEYDNLDNEFTEMRLRSEQLCTRSPTIPWSPQLRECARNLQYWRLWRSEHMTGKDKSKQRADRVSDTTVLPKRSPPTWKEIQENIQLASHKYRKCITNAFELRRKHLLDRKMDAELQDDNKKAKAIKCILQAERKKYMFRKFKNILKPQITGTLETLLVPATPAPDGSEQWTRIVDSQEIQKQIMERNQNHFGQAKNTPFQSALFLEMFGTGSTEDATKLVRGELEISTLNETEATKEVLTRLRQRLPENSIKATITPAQLRSGYKKWRERTSTSPSGLHLGHQKSIMKDNPPEGEAHLSDRVFGVMAMIIQIALITGRPPPRWRKIITSMLEKVPGRPLLNKLRVIHLMESDFNLTLGILLGLVLMQHCEKNGVLGDEQYGSRQDRSSTDVLLFKHLMYAIMRITRTDGATFDNDAKSCFDRIPLLLVALRSRSLGVDPKVCELLINTLHSVQYHLKTAAGISEESYCHSEESPLIGVPQGGVFSPPSWTTTSTLGFECMQKKAKGMTLIDPHQEFIVHQKMSAIVDDTTNLINDFRHNIMHGYARNLVEATRTSSQWWEEILSSLGGKLELSKCFYYIIRWEFTKEGRPQFAPRSSETKIQIRDSETGETYDIEQKQCWEAHKTLGIREGPCSSISKIEFKRLREKATKMAQLINSTIFNRPEAALIYNTCVVPSMAYSFPVGTLTLKQTCKLQAPPIESLIGFMGYNRSTPRSVLFGPFDMGGVGIQHLYALQGSTKVKNILQHLRSTRPLGDELRIYLRWVQVAAGISEQVLTSTKTLPHLNDEKWLCSMREFLIDSGLGIHCTDVKMETPQRQHDESIMDMVTSRQYKDNIVCQINRCRIYLRVTWISDITNNQGTAILPSVMECRRQPCTRSRHWWPIQPRPGRRHRKQWAVFLETLCRHGITYHHSRRLQETSDYYALQIPLGSWIVTPPRASWMFDPERKALLHDRGSHWDVHLYLNNYRRATIFKLQQEEETAPQPSERAVPADMRYCTTEIQAKYSKLIIPPEQVVVATSWSSYVATLAEWERGLLQQACVTSYDGSLTERLVNHESIYVVSDGGHKGQKGTYGWTMSTGNAVVWEMTGLALGGPMSSNRAEAFGVLSWITFLKHFMLYRDISTRSEIKGYCDNMQVVNNSGKMEFRVSEVLIADYDVIKQITATLEIARERAPYITLRHVKGHQDRGRMQHKQLTKEAELNIRADELAGQALNSDSMSGPMTALPEDKAYLTSSGARVGSHEVKIARRKWAEANLKKYMCERHNLDTETLEQVNWTAMRRARHNMTSTETIFHTKWMINWIASRNRKAKYEECTPECILCGSVETADHIVQCPGRAAWRYKFIRELQVQLKEKDTEAQLRFEILQGVGWWIGTPNPEMKRRSRPVPHPPISWGLWMRGLHLQDFADRQERFRTMNRIKTPGDTWAAAIIRWVNTEIQQLWSDICLAAVDESGGPSIVRQDLLRQIRAFRTDCEPLPSADRQILNLSQEDINTKSTQSLKEWFNKSKKILSRKLRQHRKRQLDNWREVRKYFSTDSSKSAFGAPGDR